MRKLWIAAVVACGLGLGGVRADAQGTNAPKRPMTFADLMAMKRVSDPQVSPGGKWVMFSVTDVSLEKNTKVNHLWVVPLDGKSPERQMTFGDEGQTGGRFSPDGKHVAVISSGGGTSQIWIASWDEATGTMGGPGSMDGARPLTSLSTEADGAVWSPDSKRLMFVSQVYPGCSVKGGTGRSGREADPSASPQDDKSKPQDDKSKPQDDKLKLEAATWAEEEACDKARLEADAKNPVKAQVWDALLYRHWDHYTGERRSHVLVVSATDGDAVRDLTPASVVGTVEVPTYFTSGPLGYAWAPDSKEIAYVAKPDAVPAASTNNDIYTLRLDEPGAKAEKVSTSPGSDDAPAYSPDGKWLAFRSQARAGYESDRFRLMVFDREKKTIRELMPKFDRWVDEFVWAPDASKLYFSAANAGVETIFDLQLHEFLETGSMTGLVEGNTTYPGPLNQIAGYNEGSSNLRVTPDSTRIVIVQDSASSPAEIKVVNLSVTVMTQLPLSDESMARAHFDFRPGGEDFREIDSLTHINDALVRQLELADYESFAFRGESDAFVQGFIVKPPAFDASKKYPVKFLIHGGPQGAWGDAWSYRWNAELMAAGGYVVVMVNPRGSTGYGQKFVDEVSGDWGGRAYVDLMRGLDAAEAKYPFIDKTRECALGASYGGYMADWVLTHTDRFKCIVTHDGMVDPVSAYGTTEEMWFNEWEFRRAEDFPGGKGPGGDASATGKPMSQTRDMGHPASPWRYAALPADEDPFRKWSPMRFIENAKTPTLVIHSQKDYRLDVSQGFELFTALQRRGVPSKFLYFPDEGHWVLKPLNSQLWYETVGDWCDRWTHTGKYAAQQ